jgi:biphenyl-2,3-diol 1,2-dioxygenase
MTVRSPEIRTTAERGGKEMGILGLGYIGLNVRDLEAWSGYATNVLGVMLADSRDGARRFRIDSQAWRIAVERGEQDDLGYIGLEVADAAALAAVRQRLVDAQVAVQDAEAALVVERRVTGMFTCQDPDGLQVEIYYGPAQSTEIPFASPAGVSAFVGGEQGLGHVVLAAPNIDVTRRFFKDLLGFRLSDIIRMSIGPDVALELEFYHCNPRHHTLALVPAPGPKRLHHFMLQAATLDDVGFALDRAEAAQAPIVLTLGRHTNDHMVSFYAKTPSGFDVEFGFGAQEVGETWRVVRHDKTSSWGHKRVSP